MNRQDDEVTESDLDYEEIFRRGGENCGDEDFALLKCPKCTSLYLLEYEVDTLYTDPGDLTVRVPLSSNRQQFCCVNCNATFPENKAWIGKSAHPEMKVCWNDLQHSAWSWITQRSRHKQERPDSLS